MRFGTILALVQGWKDTLLSVCWELIFESGFRYPFERYEWAPIFMGVGAILSLIQGWSNQGWKYALMSNLLEVSYPFDR